MFDWLFDQESMVDSITDSMQNNVINESGLIMEHIGENIIQTDASENDGIYGNPEVDDDNWHMQDADYSCAVVCQEYIAEQLLDKEFSEEQFSEYSKKKGWYNENSGTSMYDVGNILEDLGINVERYTNLTLNDLAQELESGGKIICGVSTTILYNPQYADIPGIGADHAVQVIGIDCTDPNNPEVILNDPGIENGQGFRVDADTFLKSWNTSDNFAAIARK